MAIAGLAVVVVHQITSNKFITLPIRRALRLNGAVAMSVELIIRQ